MKRKEGKECFWCEGNHFQTECCFKNAKYDNCGIARHI